LAGLNDVSSAAIDDVGVCRDRIFDLVERKRLRMARGMVDSDMRGRAPSREYELRIVTNLDSICSTAGYVTRPVDLDKRVTLQP